MHAASPRALIEPPCSCAKALGGLRATQDVDVKADSSSIPLGSVYDGFSPRGQRALAQLRAAFKQAGFYAEKERRTERTLRVYPERRWKYPLLNPGLLGSRRVAPVPLRAPAVLCPVFSDGDAVITQLLASMRPIDNCRFVTRVGRSGQYHRHGYFLLPLFFVGSPRKEIIDFVPLHSALSDLHLQLTSLGFGPSSMAGNHLDRPPNER